MHLIILYTSRCCFFNILNFLSISLRICVCVCVCVSESERQREDYTFKRGLPPDVHGTIGCRKNLYADVVVLLAPL